MNKILHDFSEGKLEALKWLYEHYAPKMRIFASGLLHDDQQAKDVVHNVFINLWENRKIASKYESADKLFYSVTKNAVLDLLRHNDVVSRNERGVAGYYELYEQSAFDEEEQGILFHLVEMAIAKMPQQRQKIYCLNRLSGGSYSKIAEMLGISVNTVNNHMHLANTFVKQYVHEHLMGENDEEDKALGLGLNPRTL